MRRLWYVLLLVVSVLLFWYFFLKKYDYRISFKTTSSPAIVFTALEYWNNSKHLDKTNITVENQEPFTSYSYSLKDDDTQISYDWQIKKVSDSISEVNIYTKDLKNSLKQKLEVPFRKNSFVEKSTNEVKRFTDYLSEIKQGFRIEIGQPIPHNFEEKYYAYVSSKGKIKNKANLMFQSIGSVMAYLKGNQIDLDGDPFLIVKSWDQKTGEIEFDFCFPIKKSDQKAAGNNIKFGYLKRFQALKAEFHGNYRDSNFAWNALLDYADENDISIKRLPVEIYRDDPHNGGNPIDWTAEIYFPLKTSS